MKTAFINRIKWRFLSRPDEMCPHLKIVTGRTSGDFIKSNWWIEITFFKTVRDMDYVLKSLRKTISSRKAIESAQDLKYNNSIFFHGAKFKRGET